MWRSWVPGERARFLCGATWFCFFGVMFSLLLALLQKNIVDLGLVLSFARFLMHFFSSRYFFLQERSVSPEYLPGASKGSKSLEILEVFASTSSWRFRQLQSLPEDYFTVTKAVYKDRCLGAA